MAPRLKWKKNVLAWVTDGGGSGIKFFLKFLFQHETKYEIINGFKCLNNE